MNKIGLKLFKILDYDDFEPLQYWLDYDFEYDDFIEAIENNEIIELELEEDEDREEDLEMLKTFLERYEQKNIQLEVYILSNNMQQIKVQDIA